MRQPSRDHSARNTGLEHLGRHEVTKIVQTKVREACLSTTANGGLGHPVRMPRRVTICTMREDEPMRVLVVGTFVGGELLEGEETRTIEGNPVRAPRF